MKSPFWWEIFLNKFSPVWYDNVHSRDSLPCRLIKRSPLSKLFSSWLVEIINDCSLKFVELFSLNFKFKFEYLWPIWRSLCCQNCSVHDWSTIINDRSPSTSAKINYRQTSFLRNDLDCYWTFLHCVDCHWTSTYCILPIVITDCDVDDDCDVADAVADADDEGCDCLDITDISVNNKTQILPASWQPQFQSLLVSVCLSLTNNYQRVNWHIWQNVGYKISKV